jgi:hypothetical protein
MRYLFFARLLSFLKPSDGAQAHPPYAKQFEKSTCVTVARFREEKSSMRSSTASGPLLAVGPAHVSRRIGDCSIGLIKIKIRS